MSKIIQMGKVCNNDDLPEDGMEIEISPLRAALYRRAENLGLITAYEKIIKIVSRHHHARIALDKLFLAAGAAQYFSDRKTAEDHVLDIGWNVVERLPYEGQCNGIRRGVFFAIVHELLAATAQSPSMREEILSYAYLGNEDATDTGKILILMSGFTGKALEVISGLAEEQYSSRQTEGLTRYHDTVQGMPRRYHVNLNKPIYPIKLTPLNRPIYLMD